MSEKESIQVRRICLDSMLMLLIRGSAVTGVILTSIFGIGAFFGMPVFEFNGQYMTGIAGLVFAPFYGLFSGVATGLVLGLQAYAGLWVYSRFRAVEVSFILARPEDKVARWR